MFDDDERIIEPPDDVLALLTDAHCHPTDDPRPWKHIDVLCTKLQNARIGRICAMSTSTNDQGYVAELAGALPDKIVPAFGYHPWFSHNISLCSDTEKRAHYRSVLHTKNTEADQKDLDDLINALPEPTPLAFILDELREHLRNHPSALLGEVGIDKVFRLPRDPKGWTREPDANSIPDDKPEEKDRGHSLGLRKRPLTNVMPLIEHQMVIAKAQIGVAIEMRRSISFHSVRTGGALITLLEDIQRAYPGKGGDERQTSKKQRKKKQKDAQFLAQSAWPAEKDEDEDAKNVGEVACFGQVNLDLHSCTLSPEMIRQIQQKYTNVYVSFSLAINARQKDLREQLRACDPMRLLIESDWHSAEGLGARCWTMIRLAADTIGEPLTPSDEAEQGEVAYKYAARFLHQNWLRFIGHS